MMKEIKRNDIHLVSSQNLGSIPESEWDVIHQNKHYFIVHDDPIQSLVRWPGYVFSNHKAQQVYQKFVYNRFNELGIYTPSRGNLSKNNKWIFMGIRPGHVYAHLSKSDTAWLFGPSSQLLHKLLNSLEIYPYFTNVYNEPDKKMDFNFDFIFSELMIIFALYKQYYQQNELNVACMGSYSEFDVLAEQIKTNKKFISLDIKVNFIKIWHPSYLCRSYTDAKFTQWKNQITTNPRKI